jgi:hypothetical protein
MKAWILKLVSSGICADKSAKKMLRVCLAMHEIAKNKNKIAILRN